MPTNKKNLRNIAKALSEFIQGGSPEGLRVFKFNKDGKLIEVINEDSLELIQDD